MKKLLVLAVFGTFFAGCYWDRLTFNYGSVGDEGFSGEDSAVLESSGLSEEDLKRQEKRLQEIATEEEPVYRMNAGDEIEIRVYGHEDLGMTTRIGPDGVIGFAFMGQVKLSGLTIAEGAEQIRAGLAPYVKNPVVSITVKDILSETATIAGACAKPGVYGISNSTRLADLYAMAGASASRLFDGANVDVADLEHSAFFRNGEIIPINFKKAIDGGVLLHNIRIRKGDYVFIAQRLESAVTICGEVKRPHKRLYEPGMGLIETLTAAGWTLDTHWQHVIIIRDGLTSPKMYKIDVDGILAGKCRNVTLKANDIVYVPKDNLSEYNVFVRKLLPTAQLINLVSSRVTTRTLDSLD